jgi:PAS domain S-box-containing protein
MSRQRDTKRHPTGRRALRDDVDGRRYADLFQSAPVGYVVTDRDGGILELNRVAARLLGVARAPTIGQPLAKYIAPVDRPAFRRTLGEADSEAREWDLRLQTADGQTAHVGVTVNCGNETGKDELRWIVRPFEPGSRLDDERKRQAQRDFTVNAAHELQSPLAGIMSAVEVLQAGAKNEPEQRDRFLAHVERECARLNRLARALLVLARLETSTEAPRTELVKLAPLLEETTADLSLAPEVSLEINCPGDIALLTSRELAGQLISNLIANAVKFTRQGTIVVRAWTEDDDTVRLEVEDTGPGIRLEDQERVFERFYRPPDAQGEREGVGLGLAIAKAAADGLGGSVALRSAPGQGTTVSVTLPGAKLVQR